MGLINIQRHYCLSCAILVFAASHLPPMTHLWDFIAALLAWPGCPILLLGLLGYLLSVFCWYKTLHKLALSKAYALLSMSYVLVWIVNGTSRLGRLLKALLE